VKFSVWIVGAKPEDCHWRGLEDVARGIAASLEHFTEREVLMITPDKLGDATGSRCVIFNAHRLAPGVLPDDAIIYNAEQVRSDWEKSDVGRVYLERLRQHVVWDYSATNIERLRGLGAKRVVHCRVGYGPGTRVIIPRPCEEDVDVLFVGSTNERRAIVLFDLAAKKLKVETLFGVYGAERDAWISRAKVVLNIHFYAQPIFEVFRCSHLFVNSKCVVTEGGGVDPELENLARNACAYVAYDKLVDECKRLVDDEKARIEQADRGRRVFCDISQIDEVARALEESK